MYLKPLGLFIVSIPKCGSQTLERAIERVSGEKCLPGHIPVGQARKTLGEIEAWALIRDPWERLTSALNYVYGATRTHLDDAMNGVCRHQTIILKPQSFFVDGATRLFPFEALPEVLRLIGYAEEIPRANRSTPRWTAEEIRAHPRSGECAARYSADFALRAAISDDRHKPRDFAWQRTAGGARG